MARLESGVIRRERNLAPALIAEDIVRALPEATIYFVGSRDSQNRKVANHLPEAAFGQLKRRLEEAWKSGKPLKQANAMLDGFIRAYGPALSDRELCEALEAIRRALLESGFREISLLAVEWQMRSAF